MTEKQTSESYPSPNELALKKQLEELQDSHNKLTSDNTSLTSLLEEANLTTLDLQSKRQAAIVAYVNLIKHQVKPSPGSAVSQVHVDHLEALGKAL